MVQEQISSPHTASTPDDSGVKRVHWNPSVRFRIIPGLDDIDDDERDSVWWNVANMWDFAQAEIERRRSKETEAEEELPSSNVPSSSTKAEATDDDADPTLGATCAGHDSDSTLLASTPPSVFDSPFDFNVRIQRIIRSSYDQHRSLQTRTSE